MPQGLGGAAYYSSGLVRSRRTRDGEQDPKGRKATAVDLTGGHPCWPLFDGVIRTYAPLDQSISCEVLVLGGGITGATIAHRLAKEGFDTVVIDRRNFGWGSTSGSTALLMYEIDTPLTELIRYYGRDAAMTAYQAGVDAISSTRALCEEVGAGNFSPRSSVYFASTEADAAPLRAECHARREAGLAVEWIAADEFSSLFDFQAPGAIRSLQAAEIDPFRLAHALLEEAERRGARLYARTEATECLETEERLQVRTDRGAEIDCRWVIVACGFESLRYLKSSVPVSLHSSYALASEPIREFAGWPDRCLLWETARPYLYARTTPDGRALFGGEDVPFQHELARDALLARKRKLLETRWKTVFPRIPLETAFSWAGTFAETRDGLPYIGFTDEQPRAFFALCYGGNGITYSILAADLLIAALRQRPHPCEEIFSFRRRARNAG